MGFFSSFDISASALTAERLRMDVISANIANAQSTRTETGDVPPENGGISSRKLCALRRI